MRSAVSNRGRPPDAARSVLAEFCRALPEALEPAIRVLRSQSKRGMVVPFLRLGRSRKVPGDGTRGS